MKTSLKNAGQQSSPAGTPEGSREAHERALDKTLADTFPASDPLSSIPDPDIPEPVDDDAQAA